MWAKVRRVRAPAGYRTTRRARPPLRYIADMSPLLPQPGPVLAITAKRLHLSRLMAIWRSGGWPHHDGLDLELLAAGWVAQVQHNTGHQTLQLTPAGIELLAAAKLKNQRVFSPHDALAQRMARQLQLAGRIVWRELSLRAQVPSEAVLPEPVTPPLLPDQPEPPQVSKARWRVARPDLFSVRHTSVEAYLQPVVHEIKVSRADLLSDLRHLAKREAYQWLSCECHYVFPAGLAQPAELPEELGVWVLHGDPATGQLEQLRAARHRPCSLPFAVWLALAKSSPLSLDDNPAQQQLGAPGAAPDDLTASGLQPASSTSTNSPEVSSRAKAAPSG